MDQEYIKSTENINYTLDYVDSPLSEMADYLSRSVYKKFGIVLINVFILVIGLIGNLITCLVIIFSKSMHTATNFYLFNLAISDLLLLISGVPNEIFNNTVPLKVYLGKFGCLFNSWAAETSGNVSIMTITAFTIERYLAICHPFFINSMSQTSRVVKIVIIIWVVGLISGFLIASQFQFFSDLEELRGSSICYFEETFTHHLVEVITLIIFILPMAILTVLYILMGLKLIKTQNELNLDHNSRSTNSAHRRTLKMLVIVVLAFFMCWAPFHAHRLMTVIFHDTENSAAVNISFIIINDIAGILYLLSTAINPIIYSIMSNKFRKAAKEVFSRCYKNSRQITEVLPLTKI